MNPITTDLLQIPLKSRHKKEVIEELLGLLSAQSLVKESDAVLKQLLDREAKRSTAIGYDAAIPHVQSEHVEATVCALGVVQGEPIDFANPEDGPTPIRLIFLMISPKNDVPAHLRTLSKIARILKDPEKRKGLCEAQSPAEALPILHDLT